MNTYSKLAIVAVALVLAAVPAVQAAAAPNAGTFVKAGDADAVYAYAAAPHTVVCFVDLNNDGGQQAAEPLYLQVAACGVGSVAAGDIRLTPGFGKQGGSTVLGSDDDLSRNSLAPAAAQGYKFFDADGNGLYNPGDVVYVGPAGPVAINDVALNGANAFTRVTTSSPNYNAPTASFAAAPVAGAVTAIGANEVFFNADGIAAYGANDEVYLSAPVVGAAPKVGDIRLTGLGSVYNGGTTVAATDSDITVTLPATPAAGACFVDTNGDALVSAGEPIYLQFTTAACGANSVASGDYRVLATAGKQGGTLVGGSDDDFSRNTVAVPVGAAICFYDSDGSGAFSTNDPVYLNLGAAACAGATVTVNDVILSGSSHNTQVTSATSGLNNALVAVPSGAGLAGLGFFNADAVGGAAVTTGDFVYLPTVAPGAAVTPGVGALRLTQVGSFAAGSYVVSPDVDLNAAVIAPTAWAAACFIDTDADGVQDPAEPLYFQTACGTIAALSIRMTAVAPYQAGTLVKGSDDDFSRVTIATPAAGTINVYDADASAAYTNGEDLFVDFGGAVVTPNDVAITTNKYERVTTSTVGINSPLLAGVAIGAGDIATETDGLAGFTTGDVVYLDQDASGSVTVGDVRLTAIGSTTGQIGGSIGGDIGGGSSGTTSSTATSTSTSTATSTATSTSTPTSNTQTSSAVNTATGGSDGEETDDNKTPGFELVALVAALGAALVLVRRKL